MNVRGRNVQQSLNGERGRSTSGMSLLNKRTSTQSRVQDHAIYAQSCEEDLIEDSCRLLQQTLLQRSEVQPRRPPSGTIRPQNSSSEVGLDTLPLRSQNVPSQSVLSRCGMRSVTGRTALAMQNRRVDHINLPRSSTRRGQIPDTSANNMFGVRTSPLREQKARGMSPPPKRPINGILKRKQKREILERPSKIGRGPADVNYNHETVYLSSDDDERGSRLRNHGEFHYPRNLKRERSESRSRISNGSYPIKDRQEDIMNEKDSTKPRVMVQKRARPFAEGGCGTFDGGRRSSTFGSPMTDKISRTTKLGGITTTIGRAQSRAPVKVERREAAIPGRYSAASGGATFSGINPESRSRPRTRLTHINGPGNSHLEPYVIDDRNDFDSYRTKAQLNSHIYPHVIVLEDDDSEEEADRSSTRTASDVNPRNFIDEHRRDNGCGRAVQTWNRVSSESVHRRREPEMAGADMEDIDTYRGRLDLSQHPRPLRSRSSKPQQSKTGAIPQDLKPFSNRHSFDSEDEDLQTVMRDSTKRHLIPPASIQGSGPPILSAALESDTKIAGVNDAPSLFVDEISSKEINSPNTALISDRRRPLLDKIKAMKRTDAPQEHKPMPEKKFQQPHNATDTAGAVQEVIQKNRNNCDMGSVRTTKLFNVFGLECQNLAEAEQSSRPEQNVDNISGFQTHSIPEIPVSSSNTCPEVEDTSSASAINLTFKSVECTGQFSCSAETTKRPEGDENDPDRDLERLEAETIEARATIRANRAEEVKATIVREATSAREEADQVTRTDQKRELESQDAPQKESGSGDELEVGYNQAGVNDIPISRTAQLHTQSTSSVTKTANNAISDANVIQAERVEPSVVGCPIPKGVPLHYEKPAGGMTMLSFEESIRLQQINRVIPEAPKTAVNASGTRTGEAGAGAGAGGKQSLTLEKFRSIGRKDRERLAHAQSSMGIRPARLDEGNEHEYTTDADSTRSSVNSKQPARRVRTSEKYTPIPFDQVTKEDLTLMYLRRDSVKWKDIHARWDELTGQKRTIEELRGRLRKLVKTFPALAPRKQKPNAEVLQALLQSQNSVANPVDEPTHAPLRPTTGGKTVTPEMEFLMREVINDDDTGVEEEYEREYSPYADVDKCHYAYRVNRQVVRFDCPAEDDEVSYVCGPEYNSVMEANAAAASEFAVQRGDFHVWATKTTSELDEFGMMTFSGSSDEGSIHVYVDRFLRTFNDGIVPKSKIGWLPKKVWDVCERRTITTTTTTVGEAATQTNVHLKPLEDVTGGSQEDQQLSGTQQHGSVEQDVTTIATASELPTTDSITIVEASSALTEPVAKAEQPANNDAAPNTDAGYDFSDLFGEEINENLDATIGLAKYFDPGNSDGMSEFLRSMAEETAAPQSPTLVPQPPPLTPLAPKHTTQSTTTTIRTTPEIHTALDSANRAAGARVLEIRRELFPGDGRASMSNWEKTQAEEREMEVRLGELEMGEGVFRDVVVRAGPERVQVMVEVVERVLRGPRNL